MAVPKANDKSISSSSASSSSAQTAQEIKSLLQQLRKSSRQRQKRIGSSSTNKSCSAIDRDDALRLDKLRKIFTRLIQQHDFDLKASTAATVDNNNNDNNGSSSASSQWKAWLTTQHEIFISHLLDGIVAGRTTALRTFCGVLASSPVEIGGLDANGKRTSSAHASSKSNGMISERLLNKMIEAVIKSRQCFDNSSNNSTNNNNKPDNIIDDENEHLLSEEPMLALLESEFIRPHRDVQYFVCKAVHQIALDLLAGLERVGKKEAAAATGAGKNSGNNKEATSTESNNGDGTNAEGNVGIVSENICRLLMMMDYVPRNASDLEDGDGFLFTPPIILSGGKDDDVRDNEDINDVEDDSDNHDSDASDSSEDEEESTTKGRKRTSQSSKTRGSSNKRSKKTKLIAWQQPYKHRNAHQEAWLSVLRLPNPPPRTQKRVLQHLSTYVLNICPSPLRFAEYFTRSFQAGSSGGGSMGRGGNNSLSAILSLHGLFILMLDHQLEYPQFYNSLYQLLHPRILYTKHRSRFLRLLSKSLLSNSMLPAYVVASFCKKLCRLALSGPPSGGLFVLALVSNLLRKHGECACLIHRRGRNEDGGMMEDVFVEEVDDLVKTRALESSLWELTALEKHYHPAISTLAKAVGIEDDKTTPMYDMEDFMAHTYKSLFEQEKKRLGEGGNGGTSFVGGKKKKGNTRVSLTFVGPKELFTKDDVFGDFFKCS